MSEMDFLAAICAAPEDDDLRLVYADWLEEHGEPLHAEYVRTSVEWSKIDDEDDERRKVLFDRERELERLHAHTWKQRLMSYLPAHLQRWWSDLTFIRGLPGSVNAHVSPFAQDAEALMRVFPITNAHLSVQGPEDVDSLASLSALGRCEWLGLWAPPELGPATMRALVASAHLGQLKSLQLHGVAMGDEGLIALAGAAERFGRLEMLELTRTEVTGVGVTALARSPLMAHLKNLWLRDNAIGPEGLRALARANAPMLEKLWLPNTELGNVGTILAKARWPSLWRLQLDNSGLTPSSVSALLRADWFPRLRDLNLRGLAFSRRRTHSGAARPVGLRSFWIGSPELTDAGLLRLLEPYQFPHLRTLWVSDSQIGDEAIMALTAHPCTHLGKLYLMSNEIGSAGAWRLLTSPNLPALQNVTLSRNRVGEEPLLDTTARPTEPRLRDLDLANNPMTFEVARALLSRPELARLEKLRLSHSPLGAKGGELLAGGPLTRTLKELFLCGTDLQNEGVIALLGAHFLGAIRDLSLQRVALGDEGLAALARSDNLGSLLSLRLDRNPLGPEAVARLISAPWLPRLQGLHLSDTSIGDEGVAALVGSPAVRRLGYLGLSGIGLTGVGVRALLDSPHLSRGTGLYLAGNAPEVRSDFGDALAARFSSVDWERRPHLDYAW